MQRVVITEEDEPVSEIVIGSGLLAEMARLLPRKEARRKIAILAQPTVLRFADQIVQSFTGSGLEVSVVPLPDGEGAKELATVEASLSS